MNISKLIANIILVLIATVITLLISWTLPKNQFAPYKLQLDSTWAKEANAKDYLVDLNNDNSIEIITHKCINKPGHSIELNYNNHLSVIGIFGETAFIVSQFMRFADVNQDGVKEMLFVAVDGLKASLFIMEFDFKSGKNPPVKSIRTIDIDSVSYQNNIPDVVNYEILANNADVYFDLQAGYSVYPRNIYKYNFITKKLFITQRNSIVNKEVDLLRYENHDYLLAKKVIVTANTYTREQSEEYRISKNADTVRIYQHIKNLIFQYGDFASYILLYNGSLDFAFPPIEFNGWTNYTLSDFISIDSLPHIVSLTNNQLMDEKSRKITLCNLQGKIRNQVTANENYEQLFADEGLIVLRFDQNIDIFTPDLKLYKRLDGFSFASGFCDLTQNIPNEFIAFENNEIVVFSDDFDQKTSFNISQEFAPYPENNRVEVLKKDGKSCIMFNTRLFYYLFSYEKNKIAILKYPFYSIIFLFWTGILFLLLRFNAGRLEKEKLQLEKIVSERTLQLQSKNLELASQKEEILKQTEKISEQYRHLEKLDRFKEALTHALVHDLKNPLSQIIHRTNSPLINQSARKMLRLIANMLDVEKYENTVFCLNVEIHSLRKMLEEVIAGQQFTLNEKNLKLSLAFHDYLVKADIEVMLRVFDNLLSNAIRFSPQNRCIDVFAENSGNEIIRVSFKNYGVPIPDKALPFIFDKYWQFEKSDSSSYRTTGLGLTFCKMALDAHGQKIEAYNEVDGVVFAITLQGTFSALKTHEAIIDKRDLILTREEEKLIRPYYERLKNLDVNQVSDILQILGEIPDHSENIVAIKQKISDATFATNAHLFHQIICIA